VHDPTFVILSSGTLLGLFLWFITHFNEGPPPRGPRPAGTTRPVHPTVTALVLIVAVTRAIVILALMITLARTDRRRWCHGGQSGRL
jgi:hypothetical protein